jgi:hypothetical protein
MKIMYSHFSANHIPLERFPFRMELAMEGYIMENADVLRLGDEAYFDVEILESELFVADQKKTGKGRIDLLALYDSHIFGIVELKLGEVSSDNLSQILRYIKLREKIFNRHKDLVQEKFDESRWVAVLIGTSVSKELQDKIEKNEVWSNNVEDLASTLKNIPLCAIALQRYRGTNGQVFVMTETFIPGAIAKNEKDKTKYIFKEQTYNKRYLALAIVSELAKNVIGFDELKDLLPDSIQGTKRGVFKSFGEAENYESEHGGKRYFLEDPITLKDGSKIAVCNQWGIDNIPRLINAVKNLKSKELPQIVEKKVESINKEEV